MSGLLEIKKAPGAKRKIDDAAMPTAVNYAALSEELKTGKGFASYGAIVEWLELLHKYFVVLLGVILISVFGSSNSKSL
ncbi:Dihydrolipoamide acetyltransferase component of pyruvate dehydrogenase complex [Nostoc flagelliforme CCNUN1]|uniref:Dihydrolipoamide acetyltransferase component of pyruvate dehydrogenase complex n=1 Tax=Nostoc flagelliforme CCNUN1 TaxID=2038116 RepID=A0A2K8SJJ2_9NOSO|nr:hypothetical protein [Nostoc flagelliforme]AUB34995.1 Dihydrolipoamide acetyltransferase component of pyruvate dehydrogenase complex [Nostoc flagelliforme CCNUN1]